MNISLTKGMMQWADIVIPMVPRGYWRQSNIDNYWCQAKEEKKKERPVFEYHGTYLLANKYEKTDLEQEIQEDKYNHLDNNQKSELYKLWKKYEDLFSGRKGV